MPGAIENAGCPMSHSALVLSLPAELNHSIAVSLLGEFSARIAQSNGAVIRVDASSLSRFDSSALALVLACRRRAVDRGGRMVLDAAPPQFTQLATVYGVDHLIERDGAEPR